MAILRALALATIVAVLTSGCVLEGFTERRVGSAAEDLVSTKQYDNLLIEIDHPPGYAPHSVAVEELKRALADVTQKKSIEVVLDDSIPAERRAYTFSEIEALEDAHRDHRSGGETAALYMVYVAGTSAEGENTLGATYRGTSIVMFKGKMLEAGCTGALCTRPRPEFIERAVIVHEFGHAAGLVNLGAPMQEAREDGEHKGHSSDKNSVMYWAVENTDGILTLFTGGSGIPYQFTAQDKADLRAMWA